MAKLFVTWMLFLFVTQTVVAQIDVTSLSTTTTQSLTKGTDQPTTTSSKVPPPDPVTESTTKTLNPENVTNSTLSADTTTESTTTEVSSTTQIPMPQPHFAHMDYDLFCTCDLLAGRCDINCCCDPDCGTEEQRLFDRCWTPPSSYFDLHYCSADPNRYGVVWNNTPEFRTEWNPHSGLFCIVTDNVPKRRMFEEKPPITEDEMFQRILPELSNRWNDRHLPNSGLENWVYQPFYKEGSPLFILHRNGTIDILKLPQALNSASCNIAKPIGFLQPENHQCYLPGDLCDPAVRPEEWLANFAVFRLPSYSAYSNGNSNSSIHWGDMDKLAPVILRICKTESECRSDLSPPKPNCQNNSLSAVILRIGFNGTEGVRFVLVDLFYKAKSAGPVRFETIYQSLADRTGNNPVRLRSGNPGYIQGKPLVVAKLNSSGGEGAFRSLELFGDTTKSRMIRFGEDSYQIIKTNGVKMNNRTEWCSKWRDFVLENYWGTADVADLRLGAFGNVELDETSPGFWLPVQIQSELECYGAIIDAQLVILYAKSGSYDQPQNKIIGAGLTLRSNGETYCYESVDCSLLLSQTVSFVKADSPTYMIMPQPPRWKIELPRDFFYPFLLSSASHCTGFNHVYSLLLCCFIFRLF